MKDDHSPNKKAIIPADSNKQLSLPSEIVNRGLELAARIEHQRSIQKYQKPIRYFAGINAESCISFSKNGEFAAITRRGPSHRGESDLVIWDSNSGNTTVLSAKACGLYLGATYSVALSSFGDMALVGYSGSNILLWDVKNNQVMRKFKIGEAGRFGQEGISHGLQFSPDDQFFATGNFHRVTIRETETGKEIQRFRGFIGGDNGMAFSNDGSKLLIESTYFSTSDMRSKNMTLLDIGGKQEPLSFKDTENIYAVSFFPDNQKLLSITGNGVIVVWDAKSGVEILHWSHLKSIHDSEKRIFHNPGSITVSLNSTRILSGSCDGYMRLWTLGGYEICEYPHPRNHPVAKVTFLPDGQHALSGCWDGSVYLWELPQ